MSYEKLWTHYQLTPERSLTPFGDTDRETWPLQHSAALSRARSKTGTDNDLLDTK